MHAFVQRNTGTYQNALSDAKLQREIVCDLVLDNASHGIHERCIRLKGVDVLCFEGVQNRLRCVSELSSCYLPHRPLYAQTLLRKKT